MRWPFGPPHLTRKPSKKTQKQKHEKRKKRSKPKNTKKKLFSYQQKYFLVGVQNFPFLITWPKKRAPKNTVKIWGFSKAFLEKQMCVTKRPFLDPQNTKPEIPVIMFSFIVFAFSSLSTTKTQNLLKPQFIVF